MKYFLIGVASIFLYGSTMGLGVNVPGSLKPPKGLDPKTVPMFVTVGFDDNTCPTGIKWFCDFVRDKKNNTNNGNPKTFDALPVRVTFLNMTAWPSEEFTNSAKDGHEIGCHTFSHHEDVTDEKGNVTFPTPSWDNDVKWALDSLKVYCPNSTIYGFRTPRLDYFSETWTAVKKYGFAYDCSIEHTSDVWPYTLDNGPFSSANIGAHANPGKIPGLFEVPVHNLGGQVGFDYNFLIAGQYKEYGAAVRAAIDERYNGNRSPMFINAHCDNYSKEYETEAPDVVAQFKCTLEERRKMFEDIITHALSKPDVRIVPIIDVLNWTKNPVQLGATYVNENNKIIGLKSPTITKTSNTSLNINCLNPGQYKLNLYDLSGKQIATLASGYLPAGENSINFSSKNIKSGVYIVKLTNADASVINSIKVSLMSK